VTRVLIVGGGGQLAHDLQRRWRERHPDHELIALGHPQLDVSDGPAMRRVLEERQPSLVINCAAYHRVDEVEDNPQLAFAVNSIGARNLALVCRDLDAVLVHLSTDYVFSGSGRRSPYQETDPVDPPNVYGVSKVAGELLIRLTWPKHFIVRSCGLYGVAGSSGKGGNFVETMLRLGNEGRAIRVVNDQTLTPTSTWFLSDQIAALVDSNAYGTYHATCQGACTWFEFASQIFIEAGMTPDLQPQRSSESGSRARRPVYSVLENHNLGRHRIDLMPEWKEALRAYLAERRAHIGATR